MSTTFIKRICSLGLLAALGATAACQSSGAKAGGGAAAGNASATIAAAATTAAAAGGASSAAGGDAGGAAGLSGIDAKYCAAIKVADAQVLTTAPLSAAKTGGPLSCAFVLPGQGLGGDNITVTVFANDGDKKFYDDTVKHQLNGGTPLSGVGDEAAWAQPLANESGPIVAAHKGSVSCVAALPSDLTTITIDKTGGGPIYTVTTGAAAAFAAKMGVLCNDVFSAGT